MSGSVSYGLMHNQEEENTRNEANRQARDARNERNEANRKARNVANKQLEKTTMNNYKTRLGKDATVRNKLQVLHTTGEENKYYGKRANQYNRGNKQGALRRLQGHHRKRQYNRETGNKRARGKVVQNTINQLTQEIAQNNRGRQNTINTQTRKTLGHFGVNATKQNLNNARRAPGSRTKYSGMGQSRRGGSKKSKMQVKGRRVLKNGAVAGYVKQRDGTWKWRFLPR